MRTLNTRMSSAATSIGDNSLVIDNPIGDFRQQYSPPHQLPSATSITDFECLAGFNYRVVNARCVQDTDALTKMSEIEMRSDVRGQESEMGDGEVGRAKGEH